VVITDHHEAPAELPDAVAIIDPKIHGSCCPQNDIAGVGVAFKTAMALEMARSKLLKRPVYAFDFKDNRVDAVRFTPQEGFSEPRALDFNALYGKTLLFFNEKEQKVIGDMFPAALKNTGPGPEGEPVYLEKVIADCMPELNSPSKLDIKKELNLEDFSPAKALILSYLKCLESRTPGVKALWKRSLDVLTIGTIADMVPLRGENRAFTQMGLKFVGKTSRIGLQNLFSLLGWQNKKVLERDISFSIAPILNSSGRLKTAELAIELLTTDYAQRAESLASELFALNDERKKLGEECYREVKDFLIEQNDLENDRLLMVAAPIKNQGVTGIVATRLMLDYCRPVIVLLEDQGKFLGSARSFKEINIINALNYSSDLLEKFGGHIGAAGLTIAPENIDSFRSRLREYASTNVSDKDLQPEWRIDYKVEIDDIDDQFMNDLLKFSPFGIENPAPLFLAENVSFFEIRKVGETKAHLRFKVRKAGGKHIFGIGFNMGDIMVPDIIRDGTCDIVFHVEPNDYNGTRSAQLMVCDCKIRGFK
jgi:single-stranded-DNA-specific exonuclease RecJ